MSPSVSLPVTRPAGRALVVGSPACRAEPAAVLQRLGFGCVEADDPYAAMAELSRRPLTYGAVILSLQGIYKEELALIAAVKRRYPQVEIWLTDIDGRQSTLVEAMNLGADGLLGEEGLHRIALAQPGAAAASRPPEPAAAPSNPVALAPPAAREPAVAAGATAVGHSEAAGVNDMNGESRRPSGPSGPPDRDRNGGPPRRRKRRTARSPASVPPEPPEPDPDENDVGEAVLTADELRALLQEPATPPYDVKQ